ncbi:MAG: hypothetical protein WCI27_05720, partial [Candidatus Omnitrophota bacterium]
MLIVREKKVFAIVITTLMGLICLFLCLEIGLRCKGVTPFINLANGADWVEQDRLLGWKNKVGVHTSWPKSWADGKELKMTIWPGGMRATAALRIKKDRQVILLGCSFIHGWALSDEETMAWKLQEKFPEMEFLNYGTAGYGTYQSLLLLEEYLRHCSRPPAVVLYGFCDFHRYRNVAYMAFVRFVAMCGRGSRRAKIPYCLIDKSGALQRKMPVEYPIFWGDKFSVVVDSVHYNFLKFFNRSRAEQMDMVMQKLLIEINMLCKRKG